MRRFLLGIIVFLNLICIGCAPFGAAWSEFDFEEYKDGPIPDDAIIIGLENGEQSALTDRIINEAEGISGRNRREKLYRAMHHIWQTFSYDNWLNTEAFQRSAGEIFDDRRLGGCSDFAIAEMTFFRAAGIPARMVMTANIDWILHYRKDNNAMSEGHSFIEVFLEDRWYLVDSTYRWIFSGYEPESPFYPHGEYFCKRGKDFWDMGIKDIDELNNALKSLAEKYSGEFTEPSYPRQPI